MITSLFPADTLLSTPFQGVALGSDILSIPAAASIPHWEPRSSRVSRQELFGAEKDWTACHLRVWATTLLLSRTPIGL